MSNFGESLSAYLKILHVYHIITNYLSVILGIVYDADITQCTEQFTEYH